MKIFNFGSLNLDKVYSVKDFVKSGETVAVTDFQTFPGGKGLNQSVAAARAGGEVYHVGCIGSDGLFLKEYLEENNVNCDFVKTVDGASGHAIIQLNQKGQNCILVYAGANFRLEKEQIDGAFEKMSEGDIVLLQNEINSVEYILTKGREKGARIVMNPSPVTDALFKYPFHSVNVFILNETEAFALSGLSDAKEALDRLCSLYPEAEFVLTLGEKGCVYKYKDTEMKFGIFKTETVDTTGAGDTFCGYYLSCTAKGMNPKEACVYASAAAAIAVSIKGAGSSIPDMKTVEAFLQRER
ncbi:MAG: ribokinase [Clostridiaceae bacterium]|nr:ribokinase [Clostridiaceae bacterium]